MTSNLKPDFFLWCLIFFNHTDLGRVPLLVQNGVNFVETFIYPFKLLNISLLLITSFYWEKKMYLEWYFFLSYVFFFFFKRSSHHFVFRTVFVLINSFFSSSAFYGRPDNLRSCIGFQFSLLVYLFSVFFLSGSCLQMQVYTFYVSEKVIRQRHTCFRIIYDYL